MGHQEQNDAIAIAAAASDLRWGFGKVSSLRSEQNAAVKQREIGWIWGRERNEGFF